MSARRCCFAESYSVAIEGSENSPNVAVADADAAAVAPVVAESVAVGCSVCIQRSDVPGRLVQRLLWHCGRTGRHTSNGLG